VTADESAIEIRSNDFAYFLMSAGMGLIVLLSSDGVLQILMVAVVAVLLLLAWRDSARDFRLLGSRLSVTNWFSSVVTDRSSVVDAYVAKTTDGAVLVLKIEGVARPVRVSVVAAGTRLGRQHVSRFIDDVTRIQAALGVAPDTSARGSLEATVNRNLVLLAVAYTTFTALKTIGSPGPPWLDIVLWLGVVGAVVFTLSAGRKAGR